MAPNGRTSANEQRFMDDDHPAAPKTCTINLEQRARLFDWCKSLKEDERTFAELSVVANEQLDFDITRAILKNHWAAVNGKRRVKTVAGAYDVQIAALESRMAECERRFGIGAGQ